MINEVKDNTPANSFTFDFQGFYQVTTGKRAAMLLLRKVKFLLVY